jgi:hypothetical protein
MNALLSNCLRLALVAGAAIAVSACDSPTAPANNTVANDVGANVSFDMPANDASAMESVSNASTMPPPPAPAGNSSANGNASSGTTTGGDTGGNSGVESNVSGM